MLHPHEQEEADYFPQPEAVNCLREAEMDVWQRSAATLRKIDAAVAAGKFVAVVHIAQYCRATDAACGTVPSLIAVCDTYDAAAKALEGQDGEDIYPEVKCKAELFPRPTITQEQLDAVRGYTDDDIPF